MSTVAAIAKSTHHHAHHAGRDAAARALAELGRPADVALVFATTAYDQPALIAGVREPLGATPISGCSGEGVITQRGSDESTYAVVVALVASDRATFRACTASGFSRDPRACGLALAAEVERASPPCRCLLIFPDGLTGNATALLAALEERLPEHLVVAGGTAGDLARFEATYQYGPDGVISDGVGALIIGGDIAVEATVSHGCLPIGGARTVTRAEGGTVYEIDGRPAWAVFKEYLDGDPTELVAGDSVHLSFGQRLPPEEADRYGDYVMRTPFGLDKATGALFFPGALPEGAEIQLMRRDPDRIRQGAIDSARELAARRPHATPSLVLQFDCAGRGRIIFGERTTETIVRPLQEVLGRRIPWVGFHTYGELGRLNRHLYYHNYTVVLCALYDGAR